MSFTPLERAMAFLQAGELEDALREFEAHLRENPGDDQTRRMNIHLLMTLARHQKGTSEPFYRLAQTELARLSALTDEDQIDHYYVTLYVEGAEAAYQLLLPLFGDGFSLAPQRDTQLIEILLNTLEQRGEYDNAIALLFHLPKSPLYLEQTGYFYKLKGDHRVALDYYCSAIDTLEEQTQDKPEAFQKTARNWHGQLLLERGRIFDALGLYAEAEADFSEAQTLIPHDPMIPFMRGLMFFLGGDLDRAVVLCRESMHPDVKDVWRFEMQAILDTDSRYADLRAALSA